MIVKLDDHNHQHHEIGKLANEASRLRGVKFHVGAFLKQIFVIYLFIS